MEISTMYLTMKEKKAIEKLKQTTQQCHNSKECWENESCPDCYVEVEDILAIDTILNLIDKQQKEIEKQNKVINELIQEYEYNAGINVKDFCEDCQRKDKCIQDCHTHIKQYFIRKVEEDE